MFGPRKPVADLIVSEQVLLDLGGDRITDLVPARVHAVDNRDVRFESPRRAEDAVLFRPGVPVTVRYLRGSEMGIFRTTVESLETTSDGRRVLVAPQPDRVRWTQDIPEPQKRQFLRLDVDLEVRVRLEGAEEAAPVRARELSGGGLIIDMPEELAEETILRLAFAVDEHEIHTEAVVVRSRRQGGCWSTAVHFKRMDPTDEDAIAHFILESQRTERRRNRE